MIDWLRLSLTLVAMVQTTQVHILMVCHWHWYWHWVDSGTTSLISKPNKYSFFPRFPFLCLCPGWSAGSHQGHQRLLVNNHPQNCILTLGLVPANRVLSRWSQCELLAKIERNEGKYHYVLHLTVLATSTDPTTKFDLLSYKLDAHVKFNCSFLCFFARYHYLKKVILFFSLRKYLEMPQKVMIEAKLQAWFICQIKHHFWVFPCGIKISKKKWWSSKSNHHPLSWEQVTH